MSFRHIYVDLLFAAAALYLVALGVFGAFHPVSPGFGHDELLQIQQHCTMKNHLKSGFRVFESLSETGLRKPFLPVLFSSLVSLAYPRGYAAVLLANMFWGWLWFILLYRVGRQLIGPVASFAALCILAHPMVFNGIYSHFGNEMPACFWTAAVLAYLTDVHRFRHFTSWLILGALIGVGLLIKITVALFVGPPVVLVLALQLRDAIRTRRYVSLIVVLAGAAVTVGFAYLIWSAVYPDFSYRLHKLTSYAQLESTHQAKPFRTLEGQTIVESFRQAFGKKILILLLLGAALAPFVLRGSGQLVWLAAFFPALLTFIRAPQSSSQYMFPILIVPLWAACAAVAGRKRRPKVETVLLAVGLLSFLTQPMNFSGSPPKGFIPLPTPIQFTAIGRRLAAEIDQTTPDESAADLFLVSQGPLDDTGWFYFMLLPLVDSPHVGYVYYYPPEFNVIDEAFDDRIMLKRNYIGYLVAAGGSGSINDFTDTLRKVRAEMNRHPGERPVAESWPRFAGVKPEFIHPLEDPARRTWYLWNASSARARRH